MGNFLNYADHLESDGPGQSIDFFQKLNLKQVKCFFAKLQESMLSDFELGNVTEEVTWRQYFQIFSEIKERVDVEKNVTIRQHWHPATCGYEMMRNNEVELLEDPIDAEGKPDSYTDDELSDSDDGDSSSVKDAVVAPTDEAKKRKIPDHLNPSLVNPIFFGYSNLTTVTKEKEVQAKKLELETAENRAISNAKMSRSQILDGFEKSIRSQETVRLRKISDLEAKYATSEKKRNEEYERNEKELPAIAFKLFKVQWQFEGDAAQASFNAEIGNMRKLHDDKTLQDNRELRHRREELEAFKDVNAQELPAAERLEEISRIEIGRWIDEVETKGKELERARADYAQVKDELEKQLVLDEQTQQSNPKAKSGKGNNASIRLRSMTNVAGTAVRECQKRLEDAVQGLCDAEVLLGRAVRMRIQQDEFLPFFVLLSRPLDGALPRACQLNVFIAAIVTVMSATFDQKLNFVLSLFDKRADGLFDAKFISSVVLLFQDVFIRLKHLRYGCSSEQVLNTIDRSFFDYGLHPTHDFLTQYETKELIACLLSRSGALSKLFGCDSFSNTKGISTYLRNRFGAVALLTRGLVGPTVCKYRVHYDMVKCRPQLNSQNMQIIHEKSMTMGADDPMKPDYSKFIGEPKKKSKTAVEPLNHGHLMNIRFTEQKAQVDAAVLIQSIYRTRREIRNAELAARKQAFMEAKELAMKEMKDKVVREFRTRESGSGVGKMKWDAQVRMRQAKLRASGQQVSRSDMVMVMMEETISQARSDIEERFRKIEQNEQFAGVTFEKKSHPGADDAVAKLDIGQLFGMFSQNNVDSETIASNVEISTPRPDEEESSNNRPASSAGREADQSAIGISVDRTRLIIEGKFVRNSTTDRGETTVESSLRQVMAMPEPEPQHFIGRVRALNIVVTMLKATRIVAELPSKRLLMKYVEHHNYDSLVQELLCHFGFIRGAEVLADTLRCVHRTDLERGVMFRSLCDLQQYVEAGLRRWARQRMQRMITSLNDSIQRKMSAADPTLSAEAKEMAIFQGEIERVESNKAKFEATASSLMASIMNLKTRFMKNQLSCAEAERKRRAVYLLKDHKRGLQDEIAIFVEERYNWCQRLQVSLRLSSANDDASMNVEEAQIKYAEMRNVCREFLDIARSDSLIIISEHYQPKYLKTIPPSSENKVQGRIEAGRGMEGGVYYTYEAHNIEYRVCEDYHGIFNGSDEFAAKSEGNGVTSSLEYFKAQVPHLTVPMIASFDIFGFRIIAMAKLPTEKVTYAEDGEVRKVSEELAHGVIRNGDNFVNKNKVLQKMLKVAALKLNLAEHEVKGFKDISSSKTFCSADIKVYRGASDEFYMKDFSRSMPSETPEDTPHLFRTPRDQSVFWRLLRPEFCHHYDSPLSPDAASTIIQGTADVGNQYTAIQRATQHLIQKVLPTYVEDLIRRQFYLSLSDGLGIDFATDLHSRGINIRHIGLIRSLLWRPLPGTINIYFNDQFIRTSRDLRNEVRNKDRLRIEGKEYVIEESSSNKITAKTIPISKLYLGDSKNRITATIGFTSTDSQSDILRTVLLAEMVARSVKSIVRFQSRSYLKKEKTASCTFMIALVCEYFNVVTGASDRANVELQEVIYEKIREKYGPLAIRPSEQANIQHLIEPCTIFIIRKLQLMLGIRLSVTCAAEFMDAPVGFVFNSSDFIEIGAVVRHNIPVLALSEALLLRFKAEDAEKEVYVAQLLKDSPCILFKLSERKGSSIAENYSNVLGSNAVNKADKNLIQGSFHGMIDFERKGPILFDKFIRSIGFKTGQKGYVEAKFHPYIVPQQPIQHFSVEVFCNCTGGHNSVRTVFMSGRYALVANRDNFWTFMLLEGMHELNIRLMAVQYDKWMSFVATFDGVSIRCYVDGIQVISLETEELMKRQMESFDNEMNDRKENLVRLEAEERSSVKQQSQTEAELFFQTKAGVFAMKKAAQNILESQSFQPTEDEAALDGKVSQKQKRSDALKAAKQAYAVDLYIKNVRIVADRYKQSNEELKDFIVKKKEEGQLRSRKGVRIGAALATALSKEVKATFIGDVSCFSVYSSCLPPDRVRAHYLAAVGDKTKHIKRLYAETSSKFEEAVAFSPDDNDILKGYAQALCKYLKVESFTGSDTQGVIRGKLKIKEAMRNFQYRNCAEGIGQILLSIPQEPIFADIICFGVRALLATDKSFFSKGFESMSRKSVVQFPATFGLNVLSSPKEFIDVAAILFKEVMKEVELRFSYGEVDLGWISDLQCSELVVCLVNYACEHSNLKFLKVGEIMKSGGDSILLDDHDVDVLSRNLLTSIGFDFSGCGLLTNQAMESMTRLRNVRYINLDGCSQIDDKGISLLSGLSESLEGLSFARLTKLSDDGIEAIAKSCKNIRSLNVCNCPAVSANSLTVFAKNNPSLHTLKASSVYLDDAGLSKLSVVLSNEYLTCLDVSFCRDITDYSLTCIGEVCANLKFLNLCGNHRITDAGIRQITSNCWQLADLNIEDLYLLDDRPFWYDVSFDGRIATNEKMLKNLTVLNAKDCVNITDYGITGLSERCRNLEQLILRGCDKLTDKMCLALIDVTGTSDGLSMCDSIKKLDVSYCLGITSAGISKLFPFCGALEDIDLSGICTVNDSIIQQICLLCKTVQKLKCQKCVQVTDVSMCSIAENMWMEELDISGCHKITDDGIEVLTVACSGLRVLNLTKMNKLTVSSINSVNRNCPAIEQLVWKECPFMNTSCADELLAQHPALKVIR